MAFPDIHSRHWARLGLVVLVLLPFAQVLGHDFVDLDDLWYLFTNGVIDKGLTQAGLRFALVDLSINWHPLTWLSHMVDVELFGEAAWGHHLSSLVFHLVSALLVFEFARLATQDDSTAWIAAALFAVHPFQAESVAWVAERKNVLSTLFAAAALVAYLRYGRRPRVRGYAFTALFLGLSLLSKQMLVTFPFVALLLDWWPLRRFEGLDWKGRAWLLLEKIPLLALCLLSAVIAVVGQHRIGAMSSLEQLSLLQRVGNALVGYAQYLWLFFFPFGLSPMVLPPSNGWPAAWAAGSGCLLVALSIASWCYRRNHPYFLVGWLWFLGTLVPVIGLVQIGRQAIADRYMAVPLIGLSLAAASGLRWLGQVAPSSRALAPLLLAASTLLAFFQVSYWRDTETLYGRAVEVDPQNDFALASMGLMRERQQQFVEAESYVRKALTVAPLQGPNHALYGKLLVRLGRLDEGLSEWTLATRLSPRTADYWIARGDALVKLSRASEAKAVLDEAVRLLPDQGELRSQLGVVVGLVEGSDAALPHLKAAVELAPSSSSAQSNLATAYALAGRFELAVDHFERALVLDPSSPAAREGAMRAREDLATFPRDAARDAGLP